MKLKLTILFLFLVTSLSYSQIGVGTKNPDSSAALDVTSTTKGFAAPRMTSAQRNAIVAPVEGLMIYNLTTHCYEWFQSGAWFNACTKSKFIPVIQ